MHWGVGGCGGGGFIRDNTLGHIFMVDLTDYGDWFCLQLRIISCLLLIQGIKCLEITPETYFSAICS